jgi:hypothetical protein
MNVTIEHFQAIVNPNSKVIITSGKIHQNGIAAAGVGDMLDYHSLLRLANKFHVQYPLNMVVFTKV